MGETVLDRERPARGEVVKVYPSPLVLRLMDAGGFQRIARTAMCAPLGRRATTPEDTVRTPTGTAPLDCPPHELRVGDYILAGGRLVQIADLRYRHGATRIMILRNGAVCVAERSIRVYRQHTM
ncbi:hypothetical protein J7E99_39405 [Streptomyces sp. ISL-44]|uniref:hypothetical protein n=1 Tax=Streptomyces sp. ISL-44 TaxID=2819184 RepID=UPI001BEB45EF|nr:hypothetical protein [Streptomyces sp. ISL-44]MBT2546559.1 hypothetical protein [Streptomyces sp. ISL-44]